MSGFVEVAKDGELKDGGMKKVGAGGKDLLLARVGGKYYAADNKCPHLGGDLSGGTLEGTVVTCPRHGSQFDLADGRNLLWTDWSGLKQKMANTFKPPRPITVYEVKVEDGAVLVALP
jgi:3-phenylpropionate/trans-cinnamate dioxygenase ferredoxin component